ncbi:MAG: hypothetical protein L0228_04075 [Planctomycetes bacterium]|nr:hypothetical protein [Planctomycetota bacterium]
MTHALDWDESDFISALEVLPTIDEYEEGRHFVVVKDGLRLLLSVFPHTSDFAISVFRVGIERPAITLRVNDCRGTRHTKDDYEEYLEFLPSRIDHPDDLTRAPYGLQVPFCIRLRVKPTISLEFVKPL